MIDFPHKVQVPKRGSSLVHRPRLAQQLDTITERRLVILTAPAGYGKTSLLTTWAEHAPLRVCWYSLDRFDTEPWEFLSYLVYTVLERFPKTLPDTQQLLTTHGVSVERTTATFAREVSAMAEDFVIVLDDWHYVDHVAAIADVVTYLLTRSPNVHFVVATRVYPALPDLMLLTARGTVTGIASSILRFTVDEAQAVLKLHTFDTRLSLAELQTLVEQSDGWITAILLSVQSTLTSSATHIDAQVYRFLAEQVTERLPELVQRFLHETALFETIERQLCVDVLGYTQAGQFIDQLVRSDLFITEISAGVFRYHPLFRDFLLEQYWATDPTSYRKTARRIADHYATVGSHAPAFDLYVRAHDLTAAATLIDQVGDKLLERGSIATLEAWFTQIPTEQLSATGLCILASVSLHRGQIPQAELLANLASTCMKAGERVRVELLRAKVARSQGRYEEAIARAFEALEHHPSLAEHATALRFAATSTVRLGQSERAISLLEEARNIEQQRGDLYTLASIHHDLGVAYERVGQLHRAEQMYQQAEAYWTTIKNTGDRAITRNSLGVVHYLLGQYRDAFTTLQLAWTDAVNTQITSYQAVIAASLGDLYSDLDLFDQARSHYDLSLATGGSQFLRDYVQLANIRLLIRQNHLIAAQAALEHLREDVRGRQAAVVLVLEAEIAVVQERYSEAVNKCICALTLTDRERDWINGIRVRLLQARVLFERHASSTELQIAFEAAVRYAEEGGYNAVIIAETRHMPFALRRVAANGYTLASEWLVKHTELQTVAQTIVSQDDRPLLTVNTCGIDYLGLNGTPIELNWLKAREVLVYLVLHPYGATADALCEMIWYDRPAERARPLLRNAIYRLRELLPDPAISLQQRRTYKLDRQHVRITCDAERILEHAPAMPTNFATLHALIDMYHGPFLESVDSPWVVTYRATLEQRYLALLQRTATEYASTKRYNEARDLYLRILLVDPLDEHATAGAMQMNLKLGNRAAAVDLYQQLTQRLDDDLGMRLDPRAEVEQIYTAMLQNS